MQAQPMITVRDVPASSRFYEQVLGAKGAHGGDEYEQITCGDVLVLQLHHHDAHEHPHLCDADVPVGNGVLLCFLTGDFDAAVAGVRETGAEILEDVHVNELAGHRECMFRDPDGYKVVLTSPFGDLG